MPLLAVTTVGADRPGIIARVTGVLLEHGGNLMDSSMTILGGQFAIVLLVHTDADERQLEGALQSATADLGLVVAVRHVGPGAEPVASTHMVSVYGADRPGIVHAVAQALAERGINVTDLNTHVLEGEQPVYAMLLEVSLEAGADAEELAETLRNRLQLEVTVHALDTATF